MKKLFVMLVLVAVAAMMVTGCSDKKEGDIVSAVKAKGKLVIYTNPEFAPYEYLGDNGELVGCEMDLIRRVAAKMGVTAEIVSAEFDSILGTVKTGKADIGASGFTITEERAKEVSFSVPFDRSVQYLVVPFDSPIKAVEDLAGKKIGGQQGTTGALMVEDCIATGVLANTGASISNYNNAPDAVTAMKAGQVDAVVIDKLVAMSLAAKNGMNSFELVFKDGKPMGEVEEFGIMVAKGNEALLDFVNEVIREMAEDGSYNASVIAHQEASSGAAE